MPKHAGAIVHETTASEECVHIIGDLDEINAPELKEKLRAVLLLGRPLAVDLRECRYIGSLGLRVLLHARRSAPAGFRTLVRVNSTPARVVHLAKLEHLLGLQHSRAHSGTIFALRPLEEPQVITLEGEWDLSRGDELRRLLDRACAYPFVIVDLSGVTYIDSNCLGMLVRMRTQRVAKGYAPSHLVVPYGNIRRAINGTGFAELWPIVETLEEALGQVKHSGNSPAFTTT